MSTNEKVKKVETCTSGTPVTMLRGLSMDAPWPNRSPYSFNLDRLWYSARSPMYLRNKIVALVRVIVFHNTTKQYQTIPNNTKQYQRIPKNTKQRTPTRAGHRPRKWRGWLDARLPRQTSTPWVNDRCKFPSNSDLP
jgi:hypothetical protein